MGAKREGARGPIVDMTPVIDVSFLLIVFFLCLPFKSLDAKLLAYLPTERGILTKPIEPVDELRIRVFVAWRPDSFEIRCGERRTADVDELGRWIAAQRRAAAAAGIARVVGQVDTDRRTPHKFVIAVVNEFLEQEVVHVSFGGIALPTPDQRRMQRLPAPD